MSDLAFKTSKRNVKLKKNMFINITMLHITPQYRCALATVIFAFRRMCLGWMSACRISRTRARMFMPIIIETTPETGAHAAVHYGYLHLTVAREDDDDDNEGDVKHGPLPWRRVCIVNHFIYIMCQTRRVRESFATVHKVMRTRVRLQACSVRYTRQRRRRSSLRPSYAI